MITICKSMKSNIRIPTLLTVIVVAIVIALIPLSPLPLSASSDSYESETNAEQSLGQKNLGSGESDNFNCDENMITSATDSIDCIPSGPAPPTPPAPPTGAFTISGQGSGTVSCQGSQETGTITISAQGAEDGTVTGTVALTRSGFVGTVFSQVSGGTTDGNTFSLSGQDAGALFCGLQVQTYTVSGDCGMNVMISYEQPDAIGTYTGDVECTLL
jgi:hypothetical protein